MPRPLTRRPHRDDVLIALIGLVGGVLMWWMELARTFGSEERASAVSLAPLAVMCAAVLVRRVAQPWALLTATLTLAVDMALGSLLPTVLLFTDVVYASVVYGTARTARRVPPASILATGAVTLTTYWVWQEPAALLIGIVSAAISTAPAYTGLIVRNHRDQATSERLRAEQTALLAEVDRAQAVNAERARMARELHDLVANHLSAIAIHSTAALSLRGDETATQEALGVIRDNSVRGLTEMRRLIGILRDAEGQTEPSASPTLDGLDALLEHARATAGDGFTFTLDDERGTAALPAPVELAAYRVVQEAVTNTLKHAAPGAVEVNLWRGQGERGPLWVSVTSPLVAEADESEPRAPGSGSGLVGMRERVELLHGTLSAGAVTDEVGAARWEVRAELPVDDRELSTGE